MENTFTIGSAVKLIPGSTFSAGNPIPEYYFNTKLYVIEFKPNGNFVLATTASGRPIGTVVPDAIIDYQALLPLNESSYLIKTLEETEVKASPTIASATKDILPKDRLYNIIQEKDGWGLLRIGGWVDLSYTKRI